MVSTYKKTGWILGLVLALSSFAGADAGVPAHHCDVKDFGAQGDGQTKDTAAVQAAIDSCAQSGGQVDLHDGVFLVGMITLKSGIVFNIESSATVRGTQEDADYPTLNPATNNSQLLNCRKALIYAENARNLILQGGGTIDGNGNNPNWNGKEATRPMAVFIEGSRDVSMQNLRVINSGMWSVVFMETNHVTIQGLSVHSPYGPTRDGIDIVDCHHVLIENSDIFSEDDAICLKSGSSWGVYDVTVRNSRILESSVANGLKLGTASTGSFKQILFENIQMQNVKQAAMAVESVDGAAIDGVQFNNIQFSQTGAAAYVVLGKRAGSRTKVGSIKNISFNGVTGVTNLPWGSAISGSVDSDGVHAIENVSLKNVDVTNTMAATQMPANPPEYTGQYPDPRLWQSLPAFGFFLRHVDGFSSYGSQTKPAAGDARKSVVQEDVQGS